MCSDTNYMVSKWFCAVMYMWIVLFKFETSHFFLFKDKKILIFTLLDKVLFSHFDQYTKTILITIKIISLYCIKNEKLKCKLCKRNQYVNVYFVALRIIKYTDRSLLFKIIKLFNPKTADRKK